MWVAGVSGERREERVERRRWMYPGREELDVSFGASNNMTWSLVPPANTSALAISQTVWPVAE